MLPVTSVPMPPAAPPRSPRLPVRGGIAEGQVREVVDATDMLAVVGATVDLKKAGAHSWRGLCPFHTEKTPSFHVNPALKLYHCKGCGAGGDAIKFVRETHRLGFVEAVEWLAERAGIALVREELSPAQRERQDALRSQRARILAVAQATQAFFRSRFSAPEGRAARDYAASRGLGQSIAVRYGLGAAGSGWTDLADHLRHLGMPQDDLVLAGVCARRESGGVYDRFRNRLMFPIYSAQGDLIAFGGRDLSGDQAAAKYLNSPEVDDTDEAAASRFRHIYKKGETVFGLYQAREAIRKTAKAILVEGNLDVMTLAQAGFEHAVCAMGTALTEVQARELRRFAQDVVVIYDGDNAGRAACHKAIPMLVAAGCGGVAVTLPDGDDPDSFVRRHGAAALQALIDAAPPLLNAHLDHLVAAWDGSLQGKARVLQQAGPLFALIGHRDQMARHIAYDYLLGRLDGATPLPDSRATEGRYFARPAGAVPAPVTPSDEAFGLPTPERELFELAVWYPAVLGDAGFAAAVDLVSHDGVRLALRDLAARHRDQPLALPAIGQWAIGWPDPMVRALVLDWLAGSPRWPAGEAARQLADLVEKVARPQLLLARLAEIASALPSATGERQADLARQYRELSALLRGRARPAPVRR